MYGKFLITAFLCGWYLAPSVAPGQGMPFRQKVEVYRDEDGEVSVFSLRLEQEFLAEEFEKSNYLRLEARDRQAYLIYPKQTKFEQKHAEFYGRLRGTGKAKLRLSYEIVSENLDGSRQVDVRQANLEVAVPAKETGPPSIYRQWALQQNKYFHELLKYYPDETFFQYCLLQSKDRYGVDPPSLAKARRAGADLETGLYEFYTGSLAIQESLQRSTFGGDARSGDHTVHISQLSPPQLRSLPYKKLIDEKRDKDNVEPKPHAIAKLVPEDQYLLQFNSFDAAGELLDLTLDWGDSLLRMFRVTARDHRLQQKFEDQLCLPRGPMSELFGDQVIGQLALSGADPFVVEGADFTMIFQLKKPDLFRAAAQGWLAAAKEKYPELEQRRFNYRGHKVEARYTADRLVSSFVVYHDNYAVYSNSHRAIRKVIDAITGQAPRLFDALDYQYETMILPPSEAEAAGYLYGSEAFIKRNVGPVAKISEKRRVECFNNLVMLNNASLFYRLENGASPTSLTELVQGRFVDMKRVVCPHGGAYALDAKRDTCTCSLHNRLRYLTPNVEVPVLKVSPAEQQEYERYKTRYQQFWQRVYDPVAIRITVGPRVKLETCVLPFANSSIYTDVRGMLDKQPQEITTAQIAPSAVASTVAVLGRKRIADLVRAIPGIQRVLGADPTLTDLTWLGDRASLHLCDDSTILELDPTQLRSLEVPFMGRADVPQQLLASAAIWAMKMPVYIAIDVEDKEKATRLLDQLASTIFLEGDQLGPVSTKLDAYRLPDYKQHRRYVLSLGIYALKLRLHIALVGDQLVAATKPHILQEVIDASAAKAGNNGQARQAHLLLRLNRNAVKKLKGDLELYWAEKSRLACHRNTISIYNLLKLYETPIDKVPELAESKYGVRYFCPEHGRYEFDAGRDQVNCTVHGNRQRSQQQQPPGGHSSYAAFLETLDEVVAYLRFKDDALLATVEIARRTPKKKAQ